MSCLLFLLSMVTVGCARQGTDTMGKTNMETTMDSMDKEKMGNDMEKSMDAENMDESMKKDMQHDMK